MNKVRPEPAESQVLRLLNQFEQSLSDGDWDTLASLDNRLQRAIPALHQQAMTPALRQALEQLNAFMAGCLMLGSRRNPASRNNFPSRRPIVNRLWPTRPQ